MIRPPLARTFSVADAIRAGLWRKPGPWCDYPRRMLQMRARAFALRDAFPDVLGGLYLREEFEGVTRAPSPTDEHSRSDEATPIADCPSGQPSGPAVTRQGAEPPSAGSSTAQPHTGHRPATATRRRPASLRRDATWRRLGEVAGPIAENLAAQASRRAPVGGTEHSAGAAGVAEHARAPATPSAEAGLSNTPEPWLTARDLLTDYDNALSCAQDRETLDEIAEEFSLALERLAEDDRFAAGRILARHEARLVALEKGETA
jgi:hypothetical protein